MKKRIIATIVVTIALMSAITTRAMEEGTYTSLGVVTKVDYATDMVEANMLNGHIFEFYGTEDWFNGDFVILELSDNGTPADVTDDEILSAKYEGSLHWIMTGSRGFSIANLDDKGISGYNWYSWDEPDMYDNYINTEEIVGYTATESGLQIHFDSGNGYWWEAD